MPLRFKGIQKLSLIDYPDKICCTLFLGGCNFRCGYCHNPSLVLPADDGFDFSEEEVLSFLNERKNFLDGICVSGGEPLLHDDLLSFLKKIKSFGFEIKIDTNGSFPQRLKKIISEGLVDYLAMDIKAPPEKYHEVAGALVNLSEVEKSVEIIKESGIDYEFRTTVFSGLTPFDFERIGLWLQKAKRYYLQIANLDLPLLDEDFSKKFYSPRREELDEVMERILPFFEEVKIRG